MGHVHVQVALNLGLQITSIYDSNAIALNKLSELGDFSSVLLTTNLSTFLEAGKADLVTIATTTPARRSFINKLVASGQQLILCEKPLATSIQELDEIDRLASKHSIRIGVNHQMRYMEQYRIVKRFQSTYGLGKLCTMSVNGANFGMGMNATHYIEAFHWLCGSEISKVSGRVEKQQQPNVRGSHYVDFAGYITIESESGSVLFLDFQESLGHHVVVVYNFQFGKLVVSELTGQVTVHCRKEEDLKEPTSRYGLNNHREEGRFEPSSLLSSTTMLYRELIQDGDYPTYRDGGRAVRCAIAALRSTQMNGCPISPYDKSLEQINNIAWP